ncbi:MAG: threonine-phosphate decarboxylase CobD [Halanaerobiales bacterium]
MNQEHGGNIARAVEKYGLSREEIIDFSASINFLGPPAGVKKVIKNNLDDISKYPDPEARALQNILAEQYDLSTEELIIANGTAELIYLIAHVRRSERALVLAPTFSEYGRAVKSAGGEVTEFILKKSLDFELDIDRLLPVLRKTELFFLCNPNNPTGKYIDKDEIVKILNFAADNDTFVVIDEAYMHFVEKDITAAGLVEDYDNLLVLHSLTKFFAIPGLRLGYGIGKLGLIRKLKGAKVPWSVNVFAQLAGVTALKDQEFIKRTKTKIRDEKESLYSRLKNISGFKVYYPEANYILADISETKLTADRMKDELAKKGILIRSCSTFSGLGEDFIRVAVRSREENLRLIKGLSNL